jgi:tetratricopeptide (TPR) repeat protein
MKTPSRINWFGCAVAGAFVAFGCVLSAPALALTQQEADWCTGKNATPDLQINGCTAAIQSGTLSGNALAAAYHSRGLGYAKRGDLKAAIADFDEAIRLNPQSALPYNDRGLTYARTGDFDHAIADFNEAIRLDPKYLLAFRNRGYAYYLKHEYDLAIADYDAALQLMRKTSLPTTTAATSTRPKASSTAPSPTSTRRSGSIPTLHRPTATDATPITTRASSIAPSPIAMRRSGSTRTMLRPT